MPYDGRINDSHHTYEHSPHGILVRCKKGEWAGYYKVRWYDGDDKLPTCLVLIGYSFGEPPAELSVHGITISEIEKWILDMPGKEDWFDYLKGQKRRVWADID